MRKAYEIERLKLKILDKSHAELVLGYNVKNGSFFK